MKLYLASFMQKDNFGPGRVISIAEGKKPHFVKVDVQFKPFTPSVEMINKYTREAKENQDNASTSFVKNYVNQLEVECAKIEDIASQKGKDIQEILPFKDGDTLASWPRAGRISHRTLLVPFLERLGYDVVNN